MDEELGFDILYSRSRPDEEKWHIVVPNEGTLAFSERPLPEAATLGEARRILASSNRKDQDRVKRRS